MTVLIIAVYCVGLVVLTLFLSHSNVSSNLVTSVSKKRDSVPVHPLLSSMNASHWQATAWYFQRVRYTSVVFLNTDMISSNDFTNELLARFHRQLKKPVKLTELKISSLENENRSKEYLREYYSDFHISYVFVADTVKTISDNIDVIQKSQKEWNPRGYFLILLVVPNDQCNRTTPNYLTFLDFLWTRHRILNVLIMKVYGDCPIEERKVVFYDPFIKVHEQNRSDFLWGKIKYADADNLIKSDILVTHKIRRGMNGYPLRVSMFERITSAIISDVVDEGKSASYFGVDGYALSELTRAMGMTAVTREPEDGKEYGYLNGTFNGALGDIIYGRSDIAFNTRFVKDYGTNDIVFTNQLDSDEVCIIAPKAKRIPKWLTMAKCFNTQLYFLLVTCYLTFACVWYILKRSRSWYHHSDISSDVDTAHIFLDSFHPFVNTAVVRLPTVSSERILVLCFLQLGMIVASIFQGKLVTVIGHPLHFPDINTLTELDESGLFIGTSSQNLDDVLFDTGNPVMTHLISRIEHFNNGYGPERVATSGNITAFVRKSDAELMAPSFQSQEGTPLLHLIRECPKSYYLSYIVPKRSPYLPRMNYFIDRLFESGIVKQWEERTVNILINMGRFNRTRGGKIKEALPKVFTIPDLQLPFFILFAGSTFGTVVFIFELCLHKPLA